MFMEFVKNFQDTLREAGCLFRLTNLLTHPKPAVKLAAVRTMGNLALNQDNQKELKVSVSSIFQKLYYTVLQLQ